MIDINSLCRLQLCPIYYEKEGHNVVREGTRCTKIITYLEKSTIDHTSFYCDTLKTYLIYSNQKRYDEYVITDVDW